MKFQLVTDASQIESIQSVRVMVSAALLYTITVHFVFIGICYFFAQDIKQQRMYDHGRRLVLYGIAALFSTNFIQYGVFHAVLAWLTLICTLISHSMTLIQDLKENYQNIMLAIYYSLIAIWYIGILVIYVVTAFT